MYLSSWKRIRLFNLYPCLDRNDNTYYSKEYISNPNYFDYWNFFVRHRMVRHMTEMVKEIPVDKLMTIDGENALDVALSASYLPLFKEVVKHISSKRVTLISVLRLEVDYFFFDFKFSIYKEWILFLKENNLQDNLCHEDMLLMINSDIQKAIYFERVFPGLFLLIYKNSFDTLNPLFKDVLFGNKALRQKLSRRLKNRSVGQLIKI